MSIINTASTKLPVVYLKRGAEKRVLHGHRWIYSNEIDVERGDYKQLDSGACANLLRSNGRELGAAYFDSKTLLCGRLFSLAVDQPLSELLEERILGAVERRNALYMQPYYRAVYGDGDELPGLVLDRYGDCWVLQITTAGMFLQLDLIVSILEKHLQPAAIILHNDSVSSEESLPNDTRVLSGEFQDDGVVEIVENGVRYQVPLLEGQKTGWFYDHRESRARLAQLCKGKRVLDVYSYLGAWGLACLQQGADILHAVDRSEFALQQLNKNAALNGFQDRCKTLVGEADQVLKQLHADGEQYDVVIVDPPAFIKRRKDARNGVKAYHRINQLALKLLADNGILASCSCSLHLSAEQLRSVVATAAYKQKRRAGLIYFGGLGMDHPVPATMPELGYLKSYFAQVSG